MRVHTISCIGILALVLSSCNPSGDRCTGAYNLGQVHKQALAAAGWLEYVETNVCEVEYVPMISTERPNTRIYGRANCVTGNILVATTEISGAYPRAISNWEQLLTIVHEAAHQEDECEPRESEALRMERSFSSDLCRCIELRTCSLPDFPVSENLSCD